MNKSLNIRKVLEFLLWNAVSWIAAAFGVQFVIYMTYWYMLPFEMCLVIAAVLNGIYLVFTRSFLIVLIILKDFFHVLVQFRRPYKGKLRSPIIIKKIMQ